MESENIYTSVNIEDKEDSNYEIEHKIVEETPFTMVKNKGQWFGVIGQHRITEGYLNPDKLEIDLKKITWDRLIQVIWAVTEKLTKNNN